MNRLISMKEAATILGIQGTDSIRRARRRLLQIAEGREDFALFQVAGSRLWYTTRNDLRRILPELFRLENDDDLEEAVETLQAELNSLKRRVVAVENKQQFGAPRP